MNGALLLAALCVTAGPQIGTPTVRPLYADGEVLVRIGPSVTAAGVAQTLSKHGLTTSAGRGNWLLVRGSQATAELAAIAKRLGDGLVVEPNYYTYGAAVIDHAALIWQPDDPALARQWNLAGLDRAWYTTTGSPSVVVAVLDTGYRAGTIEAAAHLLSGWDFVNGDHDADDDNGHGTHMSSIIVQATDNGLKGAGVAPHTSLLPVKVLDVHGRGTVRQLADGIYWATDAGADIINLSLALPPGVPGSSILHDAIRYAASHDVILVGSAGNHGAGVVSYPAAYNEVIAVAAITSAGGRAPYSNRGMAIDLAAPGGDSEDRDGDGYADAIAAYAVDEGGTAGLYLGAGTSQAAAHVSGVAALLMATGEAGRARIRTLLQQTGAPWTTDLGYGPVDASSALAGGAIATVPEEQQAGWLDGQTATVPIAESAQIGLVARDLSGARLLILRDSTGTYGLVDAGGDRVAIYRLRFESVGELLDQAAASGGILGLISSSGGVMGLVEQMGSLMGMLELSGGVLTLVDSAGGLLAIVDSSGGVVALIDMAGGLLGAIESSGGVLAMLQASGGILGLISSSGGVLGMVQSSGGVMAILTSSGGVMSILETSSTGGLSPIDPPASNGGNRRGRSPSVRPR